MLNSPMASLPHSFVENSHRGISVRATLNQDAQFVLDGADHAASKGWVSDRLTSDVDQILSPLEHHAEDGPDDLAALGALKQRFERLHSVAANAVMEQGGRHRDYPAFLPPLGAFCSALFRIPLRPGSRAGSVVLKFGVHSSPPGSALGAVDGGGVDSG